VLASATSISNAGTISAVGGKGANSIAGTSASGGGGGGVVSLFAPSIALGTISVAGGTAGTGNDTTGFAGGGAGSGGAGGNAAGGSVSAATAGATGLTFSKITADPSALFLLSTRAQ
jgi:hypothetical protein